MATLGTVTSPTCGLPALVGGCTGDLSGWWAVFGAADCRQSENKNTQRFGSAPYSCLPCQCCGALWVTISVAARKSQLFLFPLVLVG